MAPEIMKGLKDVYLDTTESSFIDGEEGKLLYRGYNIHDLAEKSTFEEVVYLLLYGKLPNQQELQEFDALLRANRRIPDEVIQVLDLVETSDPVDAPRTGKSAVFPRCPPPFRRLPTTLPTPPSARACGSRPWGLPLWPPIIGCVAAWNRLHRTRI